MRLTQLQILNFRLFRDQTLHVAPGTVLVGANNSGKTTVVDALRFLLQRPDDDPMLWSYGQIASNRGLSLRSDAATVIGTFADLTDSESRYWSVAMTDDGTFRLGNVAFPAGADAGGTWIPDFSGPFVLVPSDRIASPYREGAGDFPNAAGTVAATGEQVIWMSPFGFAEMTGSTADLSPGPTLVAFSGPGFAPPSMQEVLRPLLAGLINRSSDGVHGMATRLVMHAEEVAIGVAAHLQAAIALVDDLSLRVVPWGVTTMPSPDDIATSLVRFDVRAIDPTTKMPVGSPGAGATRTALLAALQLYCDPALWPAHEQSVILAIEEPEAGLHAALQRQVATTLSSLPAQGVQTLITTHSPVFMDAATRDGIRVLSSTSSGSRITEGLDSVVAELGIRPSDILLGEHFLIVEGTSDVRVLRAWARTLEIDLYRSGLQLVPADGADAVHLVSRLAALAYPGARYTALFDGDPKGRAAARKMSGRREGIGIVTWSRGSIEEYFSPRAVDSWWRLQQLRRGGAVSRSLEGPVTIAELVRLARAAGLKTYPKVEAGEFIASLMRPEEIDAEVTSVFARLLSSS